MMAQLQVNLEGKSVTDKCKIVTCYLQDIYDDKRDLSEFQKFIPYLCEAIFLSTSTKRAWILSTEPNDVKAVVNLLHPNGLLFLVLTKFQHSEFFTFPFQRLPELTKACIPEDLNGLSPLFRSKIDERARVTKCVLLNTFEFFFCWFAHGCTVPLERVALGPDPSHSFFSFSSTRIKNCYLVVLKKYLRFLWPSTTQRSYTTGARLVSNFDDDKLAKTFLYILVEFWLRQSGTVRVGMEQMGAQPALGAMNNPRIFVPPTPTTTQAIKIVLQHFLWSLPALKFYPVQYEGSSQPVQLQAESPEKIERGLFIIRPALYQFLKASFLAALQVPPPEIPYGEIVRLWVMFMNPWEANSEYHKMVEAKHKHRIAATPLSQKLADLLTPAKWQNPLAALSPGSYQGVSATPGLAPIQYKPVDPTSRTYLLAWQEFSGQVVREYVFNNLAFFVPLLGLFLARAVDYCDNEHDLALLSKVLSVFAKSPSNNILEYIQMAEHHLRLSQVVYDQPHGSLYPRQHADTSMVRTRFVELEQSEYVPFVDVTKPYAFKIAATLNRTPIRHSPRSPISVPFTKTENQSIEGIIGVLCETFQIHAEDIRIEHAKPTVSRSHHPGKDESMKDMYLPDGSLTEFGRNKLRSPGYNEYEFLRRQNMHMSDGSLTAYGRRMLRLGFSEYSQVPILIKDPRLYPITSMENPTLVRVLYRLSVWIEQKTGKVYNLRFLASYSTWFIILSVVVFFLFCWLVVYGISAISTQEREYRHRRILRQTGREF